MSKAFYLYLIIATLFACGGCDNNVTRSNQDRIRTKEGRTTFFYQEKELFRRDSIFVKTKNMQLFPFAIEYKNGIFTASLGRFGSYKESLNFRNDGSITGIVNLHVTTNESFIIQCPFQISKEGRKPYFMIPGFLYGSNNLATSDGQQPKFDYSGEIAWPTSSKFYIRADRSTHPGVICIKNKVASIIGISETMKDLSAQEIELDQATEWDPAYLYNGLMLDSHFEDRDIIGFQLGYENAPGRYSWTSEENVPKENEHLYGWIDGQNGKSIQTETFYAFTAAEKIPDYGKLIELYYPVLHQAPLKRSGREEAIQKISNAIIEYSWNTDIKGFELVDGGNLGADIAWTGGMQVAYPLLKTAKKTGNNAIKDIAYEYITNLCTSAMNERANLLNEEYRDGKWNVTGWWGVRENCFNFGDNPLHSAYLNGQASYYLLKSYELEERKHDQWLNTARTVLETALSGQREDGALPVFFDPENGDAVDYDGFQPCWFVPGLVLLHKYTGEQKYLEGAEKAINHYYGHHLRGELYNTPMDIHRGVDQEGNLAFITACVEFHKLTNDPKYLDMGIVGLSWEYSWKFAYNTVHSAEPLKSMNWSSSGGSITSNYNVSMHQMGNLVAGEMYYLFQKTGSEYIRKRLHDTCIWGLGTYNTKDNDFGFGKEGQATEQFFYTDGLVLPWPGPWDGGIWAASLSWASACVLLSCVEDIPDEFFQ